MNRLRASALLAALVALALPTSSYAAQTLASYAQECAQEIGATIPDLNCLSGSVIPMNAADGAARCDKPPYLGGPGCAKGARLLRIPTNNADVDMYLSCRHYGPAPAGGEASFNDIAIIQRNVRSGATCFYQSPVGPAINGTFVPSPSRGTSFWMAPAQAAAVNCVGCHDADSFIRTPYIKQVQGINAIPERRNAGLNYWFPGTDFSNWVAYSVKSTVNGGCTSCHVMGTSGNVGGMSSTGGLGSFATEASHYNLQSDHNAWMLRGPNPENAYQWVAYCAKNHNAAGCVVERRTRPAASQPMLSGFLQNNLSGKCIDVGGQPGVKAGSILWLFACEWSGHSANGATTDMRWTLTPAGYIVNQLSGRCLDVDPFKGPYVNYGQLTIQDCQFSGTNPFGNPSGQRWTLDASGFLRNNLSGKCVEVEGQPGTQDGAKVQLADCETSGFSASGAVTDQQWHFQ